MQEKNDKKSSTTKVFPENEKTLIHEPSCNSEKTIGKCKLENRLSPETEFDSHKNYAKQTQYLANLAT